MRARWPRNPALALFFIIIIFYLFSSPLLPLLAAADYAVYSKAWRSDAAAAAIYKPRGGGGGELGAAEADAAVAALQSSSAFTRGALGGAGGDDGRDFEGVPRAAGGLSSGAGPVQFERAAAASAAAAHADDAAGAPADVFGLDQFMLPRRGGGGGGGGGGAAADAPRRTALDGVGRGPGMGFMAAAAGGGFSRGADGEIDKKGSGRSNIRFTEATGR